MNMLPRERDGLFSLLILASAIATPLAHAAQPKSALVSGECGTPIRTAADAMSKADWVMEGTVYVLMKVNDKAVTYSEETIALYNKGPKRINPSTPVEAAPCYSGGAGQLDWKTGKALHGKRMRFYGTRYTISPTYRFFYMEPADNSRPDIDKKKASDAALTKMTPTFVRTSAQNPYGDGWHHAHSTLGGFSVDLPGPFEEATAVNQGSPGFMLRAKDKFGSTFIAVFEPSGPDSGMGGTIDHELEKPEATVTTFRGFPALLTIRSPMKDGILINHSMMFRVPGGSYMLGIVTTPEHEVESMRDKDRFYNSLKFE